MFDIRIGDCEFVGSFLLHVFFGDTFWVGLVELLDWGFDYFALIHCRWVVSCRYNYQLPFIFCRMGLGCTLVVQLIGVWIGVISL